MSDVLIEAVAAGGVLTAVAATAIVGNRLLRGRRKAARLDDEEQAMERAGASLAGFRPLAAVIGADGAAALVSGSGPDEAGRLALVHAVGRHLAAREVDWNAVRATPGGIVVETGQRRVGGVPLAGIDALDVRRLAPAASDEAVRVAERLAS
ncbi:hypothetical protein [Sphingomonas bacterium]|uniref:hypothetical protein n=1 Tax=Sphingomonas bacterium TaxID=1895847 RepID=UPI001575FC0E|nr:hypothetical protein [Sphingomonas bacterium]